MIDKIVYALLLLGALAMAAQVALILLVAVVVAGLIFRPKETFGLLMIGGLVTALSAAPFITLGVIGVLVTISLILKAKEKKKIERNEKADLPEADGPSS